MGTNRKPTTANAPATVTSNAPATHEQIMEQARATAQARIDADAEYQSVKASLPQVMREAFENGILAEEMEKAEAPIREAREKAEAAQRAFIEKHGLASAPAVMLTEALRKAGGKAWGRVQSSRGKFPGKHTGTAWALAHVAGFIGKPTAEFRKSLEAETGRMDYVNILAHCAKLAKASGLELSAPQSGLIMLKSK